MHLQFEPVRQQCAHHHAHVLFVRIALRPSFNVVLRQLHPVRHLPPQYRALIAVHPVGERDVTPERKVRHVKVAAIGGVHIAGPKRNVHRTWIAGLALHRGWSGGLTLPYGGDVEFLELPLRRSRTVRAARGVSCFP